VRGVITRYFEAMNQALERHGGTVEKFIGDAVMAVFGVPAVREDDAFRAVRAAAEMRAALGDLNNQLEQRFGVRLRVRIGVNTGEVIAGDPSRGHGFVTGDAVNVAARLEQAAPDGEALLGERTLELVRDRVQVEPVPKLDLKGKSEPVAAFRLVRVDVGATLRGSGIGSPLVGRQRELALLEEAYARTLAGPGCELVTVVGSAGMGKSRLAEELAGRIRDGATVVAGRCLSYGEGLAFWPLREVVAALTGFDDGDSVEEAQAAIARMLPEDDEAPTVTERLAGALALSDTPAYPRETFWAVRRLLEAAAGERPLVVLFEDVHWGEDTFLELIEHLGERVREVPMLVVVVARTDLLEARPGFAGGLGNSATIALEPLSGGDSRLLVEQLLGDHEAAAELSEWALIAGEGNPLFLEELVRMLVEESEASGGEPGSSVVGGLARASVPTTIHALLAARLERLDPGDRGVLEAAAVVGRSFTAGALLELFEGGDPSELDQRLQALVDRDLIQPEATRLAGEQSFSFAHLLLRDVAYRGILKEVRADLHERYANWLERTAGERVGEYAELLGYHLARAYSYLVELGPTTERGRELAVRAAARLGSSGQRALARGDFGPAVRLLDRAISLLPHDHSLRRDLALKLGIALAETGDLGRADSLLHDRIEAERRGTTYVVFHDNTGRRHTVDLDPGSATTIGRLEENGVALTWDIQVSRRHAKLHRAADRWVLVDEGSSNGSCVNGEPVTEQHSLQDGDVLRFGDTVVLFRAPVSEERPAASVPTGQATVLGAPAGPSSAAAGTGAGG
jgi:hypothetical protein